MTGCGDHRTDTGHLQAKLSQPLRQQTSFCTGTTQAAGISSEMAWAGERASSAHATLFHLTLEQFERFIFQMITCIVTTYLHMEVLENFLEYMKISSIIV